MPASTQPNLIKNIPDRPRRLGTFILAAVAMIAMAVYANSLPNHLTLDDCGIIQNNPVIQNLQWDRIIAGDYWPTQEGPHDVLYRPLTMFSYAFNQYFSPAAAWPFHLVNILLHPLVCMLVALLAWRLFQNRIAAFAAGLIFAIHPIHTEAVANVVGRAELLSALWTLLAFVVFLPESSLFARPPQDRPWWHGWLVAACFFLALLSKETSAGLIFGFAALDVYAWYSWNRPKPAFWRWIMQRALRYYLPISAAFAAYLGLRVYFVGLMMKTDEIHPLVNVLVKANPFQRVFTPFLLLAKYITLMLWPQVLSADYSAPSILPVGNPLHSGPALAGIGLVLLSLIFSFRWAKRFPAAAAAIVLFFLSYATVANYIRIGTIFGERLFYLPSVFICLLAGLAVSILWQRAAGAAHQHAVVLSPGFHTFVPMRSLQLNRFQWFAASTAVLLACLLAIRTIVRNPDWHDNMNLALATAMNNPDSAKSAAWAGNVLLLVEDHPEIQRVGEQLLKRSIALYPTTGDAYWSLSKFYMRQGHVDQSLIFMAQAAQCDGGKLETRKLIDAMHDELKLHNVREYAPAAAAFLRENPRSPAAHFALALSLWAQGKLKDADDHFNAALALDVEFAEADAELGLLKLEENDPVAAVLLLKKYVLSIRNNERARCELATALMALDHQTHPAAMAEAAMNLNRAALLVPDDPEVRALRTRWIKQQSAFASTAAGISRGPAIDPGLSAFLIAKSPQPIR